MVFFQRGISCTCIRRVRDVVFEILGEGLENIGMYSVQPWSGGDLVLIPTPTTFLHRDQHQRKGNTH